MISDQDAVLFYYLCEILEDTDVQAFSQADTLQIQPGDGT